MLLPIASSLEYWCHIKVEDTTWKATIKRFIARLCCIAFTLLIAEVVPNIQSLINVLGSFTMVIMVAMMPCIFYVRVQQFVLGKSHIFLLLTITLVSSFRFCKEVCQEARYRNDCNLYCVDLVYSYDRHWFHWCH